jgi:hypothetical protein
MINYHKFDSGLVLGHDLEIFKGKKSFNYVSKTSEIAYHNISNIAVLADKFFTKKLFSIEPHLIYYAEITGPGFLDPHIDHSATTVANFYFDSNDSITTFYETTEQTTSKTYDNMKSGGIFDVNTLTAVESFQAKDGESYILNVSKIHGVSSPKSGTRKFINMQWYGVDFQTICNSIIC